MSLAPNAVLAISLLYVAVLFAIAFYADTRGAAGRSGWLNGPVVYTLSISIYCTSWTFYGAVGSAARSGLEFATIYLGPTLVFIGWWAFMRKLVRISHRESVTSIADFLSSRYGKNAALAALATLIAVIATLPYIALQLKALAASYQMLIGGAGGHSFAAPQVDEAMFRTAFWAALGMAAFTILFGTRNLDAKERHHGLVAAIAFEALVKLAALIAVGVFAVYVVSDGPSAVFQQAPPEMLYGEDAFGARWVALIFLAGAAVVCLPRQFHVTVVECLDEDHGRTASWAFPLYLFLISLFVLPIAIVGMTTLPVTADEDLFVLSLPLAMEAPSLAMVAFLGGFSSATSMVIVACIALSTMVSNHLAAPLALYSWRRSGLEPSSGDVQQFLLLSRRVSICVILGLSFLYFRWSGSSDGLASIGLIAFAGVAQLLPPILAAMYWPRATAFGAAMGMMAGFGLWAALLFAPSFAGAGAPPSWIVAALDLGAFDPLVTALFWSLSANALGLVAGSLLRAPSTLERIQAAKFVDVFRGASEQATRAIRYSAGSSELFILAQRILGAERALKIFEEERIRQGLRQGLPEADAEFVARIEARIAGTVGAATARAMMAEVATGEVVSAEALRGIASETARLVDYSLRLKDKSQELEQTAIQLRVVNERLQRLDAQKDAFLSQISHELRTPMTAVRSFAEILLETPDVTTAQAKRFLGIMHDESLRLTRLLDQILDLSQLENAQTPLRLSVVDPAYELDRAIETCAPMVTDRRVAIHRLAETEGLRIEADADRLRQVFLNVLANAVKYNTADQPGIWIESRVTGDMFEVVISDNGPGVPAEEREIIFSRFARGEGAFDAQGAGLGLAICRQIMARHQGGIELMPAGDGAAFGGASFRIRLPLRGGDRPEISPETADIAG